ncbi:MAG: hypothetical protein ACLPYB_03620 [Desulfobaccales bacterium]
MVGMLQIMTYILCVYLIFKGIEILQIALMSNRENRTSGIIIGIIVIAVSIIAALIFTYMIDVQANSVSQGMRGR